MTAETSPSKAVWKSERLWTANQSWHYEVLILYGKFRMKVDIKRNAYDFQSHLRIKIFNAEQLQWNMLLSRAMTDEWRSSGISYVNKSPDIELCRTDARKLLEEALLVLDVDASA